MREGGSDGKRAIKIHPLVPDSELLRDLGSEKVCSDDAALN